MPMIKPLLSIFVTLSLSACGIKHSYKVQGALNNESDYPAVLTLRIEETSHEDNCGGMGESKTVAVAPRSQESAEMTLSCSYEPRKLVSFQLHRGLEQGKPAAKMVAYNFGSYRINMFEAGETIYWLDASNNLQSASISNEPFYDVGVGSELPDTEALLANPVRTDGRVLQMFFANQPEVKVQALGVAADSFAEPCEAGKPGCGYVFEREGVYFIKVHGHNVTGGLYGSRAGSQKITCKNEGCSFD